MTMRWAVTALVAALLAGCVQPVVGMYAATLDQACEASEQVLTELGLPSGKTQDFQECIFRSQMADGRKVTVVCHRLGDKTVEVRVLVGATDTAANRAAAQEIYSKIVAKIR